MKKLTVLLLAMLMIVCLASGAQAAGASSVIYPETIIVPVKSEDALNGGISYDYAGLNDWGYNTDFDIYLSDIEDIWVRYFKREISQVEYRVDYNRSQRMYLEDRAICYYRLTDNAGELKIKNYNHSYQSNLKSGYWIIARYLGDGTISSVEIKSNDTKTLRANGSVYTVPKEEYLINYINAPKYAPKVNQWYIVDAETECPTQLYNPVSATQLPNVSIPGPLAVRGTLKLGDPYPTQFDPNVSGMLWDSDNGYYVSMGNVDTSVNGLIQDPDHPNDWYFLALGKVQSQYSGLAEYDGEWFYLEKGKLNTAKTGLVGYDGGRFMVAAGRILREVNGLIQEPDTGDWYYCAAGQVADYTGLALYDNAWFYVDNGKLDIGFTGDVEYDGAMFHVDHGMMVD